MISGEWAVQELKYSAIVAAINHRLFCQIEPNPEGGIEISLLDFNIHNVSAKYENEELVFNESMSQDAQEHLKIIKFTIETALFILPDFKPFKIKAWTEKSASPFPFSDTEFGLGTSSGMVVATHAAIRAFHGLLPNGVIEKDELFKLCLLTHFIIQNKSGSGIDIAASFHGGILRYSCFDPEWLLSKLEDNFSPEDYIDLNWPNLSLEPLPQFPELQLLLGWTQTPVSTAALVDQMTTFKKQAPSTYYTILNEISKLVKAFVKDWKKKNKTRILSNIQLNEMYLRKLGENSGIPIETAPLKLLSQIANELGGAGKLSGAVGGDCGIAICFDDAITSKILAEWGKQGIIGAPIQIDFDGLIIESITKQTTKILWKK